MRRLILASASPRRKELLEQVGAVFEVIPAKGEETVTREHPGEAVMELALQKAREVACGQKPDRAEELLVLGADTVVAFEGQILGKPVDEKDAVRMLSLLGGKTHEVYTGVAVIRRKNGKEETHSFYEETRVTMYPMSRQEIEAYVKTGEPFDKAGSYAIQGRCAVHIQRIDGDYNNVVGLPVARIYQEMSRLGIDIYSNPYYDK